MRQTRFYSDPRDAVFKALGVERLRDHTTMSDFSIEMAVEQIHDERIRRYFSEVYSSYVNGNYRSAIVMLWSVAVCDVLFKLDHLKTAYGDTTAEGILTEIEEQRKKNPKSPEWEQALIDKVKGQTHLFEESDYVNLNLLREHRHLSAHPVLSDAEALFSPTKEQVRAHVRNTLDGLLTKPPIMTRKVFNAFMEDIEGKKDLLPDDDSLSRYLEAKYFGYLTPPIENAIFRSLWRVVFKTEDDRCEDNRGINYRALRLLYRQRSHDFNDCIKHDATYFSELHYEGTQIDCLLDFLSEHPVVYTCLTAAATTPLENYVRDHPNDFAVAWYLSVSIDQHLDLVLAQVDDGVLLDSKKAFKRLYVVAKENGCEHMAIGIAAKLYASSISFHSADVCYERFIRPHLLDFNHEQLVELLAGIEENGQTYNRRGARRDHEEIRNAINDATADEFDFTPYPHFCGSIGLDE